MEIKQKASIVRVGKIVSLIIGILYLGVGVLMIFDPAEKYRGEEYLNQLYLNPIIPQTWRYMFVVIAFLTIFWISAMDIIIREKNKELEGLYRGFKIMAYASAIISSIQWYKELYQWHYLENFLQQPEYYKVLIPIIGTGIDPDYIWMFGVFGLWYFFVSILAQRQKLFSFGINLLGILSGVALLLTMIFAILDTIVYFPNGNQMAVMQFTSLFGGVCGAIYHILAFVYLQKRSKELV